MSKSFSFPNVGTCSRQTNIVLNDDHTIESVEVIGGCNGNLKGISRLLKGMKAEDAIARMEGTTPSQSRFARQLSQRESQRIVSIQQPLKARPQLAPPSGELAKPIGFD